MEVAAILWDYRKTKSGLYPVKIRISHGSDPAKYVTLPITILPADWDRKKGIVKSSNENATKYNLRIREILSAADSEILAGNLSGVIPMLQKMVDNDHGTHFTPVTYFEHYIKLCKDQKIVHHKSEKPLSANYIKHLTKTKDLLSKYVDKEMGGRIRFQDIGDDFRANFVAYLRNEHPNPKTGEKGVKQNSISSAIKRLRTVFKRARTKDKLLDYDCSSWTAITEEVDNIALTEEEIRKIIKKDLSQIPYLEAQRKRFLVAYNFLLRFGDSITVSEKNLFEQGGRHYFKMTTGKTKEPVIIPVMPIVYEILKNDGFRVSKITNQVANRFLKELCFVCEITDDYTMTEFKNGTRVETVHKRCDLVTTHTTRRSAATNLYLSGVDLVSIMKFGGWRSMKQLLGYIKIDKIQNAQRHTDHAFFRLEKL